MNKILVVAACLFVCTSVFAQNDTSLNNLTTSVVLKHQPRFFINVHSGYAVGLGSTFKFYPDDITSISVKQVNNEVPTESKTYKSTSKGLGDGFRVGAGISYILNDFINLGFDFDYFKSSISRASDSSFQKNTQTDANAIQYNYNQSTNISYTATLLTLSPNITFKAISRPKFYIYNKVGAVITYRPNSIQKNTQEVSMNSGQTGTFDSSSNTYTRYEWGIKKPALGFMASVGAQFKLSEKLRFFSEIQFSHIVFAVRNRVLTDYVVNGSNLTSTLSESEKVIEFKNAFSTNQQNPNPNQPTESVVQRIPITYIGLQAGLAYRF